jgi:DNA repair protein RadC
MTKYVLSDKALVLDDVSRASISAAYDIKKYDLKVRDLPEDELPREKLIKNGPASLSTAELLAVIMTTGTKKEDVLQMSSRVLKDYGEQTLMSQTDVEKMAADLDIPLIKATQIVACGELGRRFFQRKQGGLSVIRTPKDVFNYCFDMRDLPKEQLRGIYLNAHHRVIHDEVISIGTVTSSMIHPREVFKPAVQYGAVGVIVAHNHPSGILKPSRADIDVTRQLIQAGEIMGISLLDHVILTKSGFASVEVTAEPHDSEGAYE